LRYSTDEQFAIVLNDDVTLVWCSATAACIAGHRQGRALLDELKGILPGSVAVDDRQRAPAECSAHALEALESDTVS
jgi:hypothetical protein